MQCPTQLTAGYLLVDSGHKPVLLSANSTWSKEINTISTNNTRISCVGQGPNHRQTCPWGNLFIYPVYLIKGITLMGHEIPKSHNALIAPHLFVESDTREKFD